MQTLPGISLSVNSYKGILYLENLGGGQVKKNPAYLLNKHGKNKVLDVRFNWGDQAEPGSDLHSIQCYENCFILEFTH